MKIIVINAKPEKTPAGIVRDFERCILAVQPHLSLSALYQFQETFVRFHMRRGKTGMTFLRPVVAGSKDYNATRVTTGGKRVDLGRVTLE